MIYNLFKKVAFSIDPEVIHDLTISTTSAFPSLHKLFKKNTARFDHSLTVGSVKWKSPVGLAAGLDKNARCLHFFTKVGFGAVEVGTVTPLAQAGNDRPRLFRLPRENSLKNRMGFNNEGSESLFQRLLSFEPGDIPIGVNIGKNKVTPNDEAYKDYQKLYHKFKNNCDYIVINVSSPNTPGLRENQTKESLEKILASLDYNSEVDLYVKIAPDIDLASVDDVIDLCTQYNLTGIIATNTTIIPELGEGGVSGRLLYDRAKLIRSYLCEKLTGSHLEVIGVGGFENYNQIVEYWKKGGRSLQVYSSFIYQGPSLLTSIEAQIDQDIESKNLKNVEELISHYKKIGDNESL